MTQFSLTSYYRLGSCLAVLLFSFMLTASHTPPIYATIQTTRDDVAHDANTRVATLEVIQNDAPLCRLGLNVSSFPNNGFYIDNFDIAPLRVGWYIDYRATPSPAANNGAEYAKVMSVWDNDRGDYRYSPTGDALDETILAHPGGIYIIGNEPDRRELQHDVFPENYAYIYHEAYEEIKRKDPTAQVWAGAIVQPTPIRLEYLDKVLAAYRARYSMPMPVDGWAIHAFLLNERSCAAYNNDINVCWGADIPPGIDATDGQILRPEDNARVDLFAEGIQRFRRWMANNGYRDTPLYVSEYGVLMPPIFGFPPSIVNNYMRQSFDYMLTTKDKTIGYAADDYRLVQRFSWFSTFDPNFNGYLYQSTSPNDPMAPPFVLSEIGEYFSELATQTQETSDLAVLSVQVTDSPRQVVATIGNSGNRLASTRATVRFFEGETFESARQIGQDVTVDVAGCGATQTVAVSWGEISEEPTRYRLWAQVSHFNFADDNPNNDLVSSDAFVNGQPLFLPTLKRTLR